MQAAINENASKGKDEMNELREMILQERDERTDEAKNMNDFFTKENDERKKNLDDVNEWIGVENAKRFKKLFSRDIPRLKKRSFHDLIIWVLMIKIIHHV